MNEIDATAAIEVRLKDNFNKTWAQQPPVKIVYENTGELKPAPPYVKFFVRHVSSNVRGYGGASIEMRRYGTILAQIFTERGIGAKQGRLIGLALQRIYEGQQFGGVMCREYTLLEVGVDTANAELFQCNARIRFDFDTVVTY